MPRRPKMSKDERLVRRRELSKKYYHAAHPDAPYAQPRLSPEEAQRRVLARTMRWRRENPEKFRALKHRADRARHLRTRCTYREHVRAFLSEKRRLRLETERDERWQRQGLRARVKRITLDRAKRRRRLLRTAALEKHARGENPFTGLVGGERKPTVSALRHAGRQDVIDYWQERSEAAKRRRVRVRTGQRTDRVKREHYKLRRMLGFKPGDPVKIHLGQRWNNVLEHLAIVAGEVWRFGCIASDMPAEAVVVRRVT